MTTPQPGPADLFRSMALIRHFEERALELSRRGEVAGSIHLCTGQEAIPVGAMSALRPGDRVLSTYRGHGWALACGADPAAVMAEIAQRADGTNGGRAGSPLLSAPDQGFLGENSIVGAGVPIATGVAMAAALQDSGRVALVSIGDGAMNQGATAEGLVFAAARNLPVIFVCENNGWSEMTPIAAVSRTVDFAGRARALGVHAEVVDGGDPERVADAVRRAAERCRAGDGPVFLECETVRLGGHYNKDVEHYRPDADREAAAAADPLKRFRERPGADLDELAKIESDAAAEMAALAERVVALPFPDPATVHEHVYGPTPLPTPPPSGTPEEPAKDMPYWRAVNSALADALDADPGVVVYGEDVGFAGGIFGVTRGLQKRFGDRRVFDTPISEAAILGSAVGAALDGARPIVEIMWADFMFVALDQIVNQAANVRYVNRSRLTAPLTIRMQQGVTPGSCAQHSQSVEAFLAHVPGIKVGLPSTPQDAYAMTRAAIADPDPVVLIEHRGMYTETGRVARGGPAERAHGARTRRSGADACVLTWGTGVATALAAAELLAAQGIEATVLDLRWLRPLDDDAIADAVARTSGRVLVVHEATRTGGFGAEVAARVTEAHFASLAAPVARVATPEIRMPSAPVLQRAVLPTPERVAAAVRGLVTR
ncbi:thiamine pyrophosphate-dependent enzyme [Spirillospora sp. NBC_00431]